MPLNEADTRARLIDPRLEAAGWGSDQVTREHYYRRDVQYTPGRIILRKVIELVGAPATTVTTVGAQHAAPLQPPY